MLPGDPWSATASSAAIEVGRQQQPGLRGGAHEGAAAVHDEGGATPNPEKAVRSSGE